MKLLPSGKKSRLGIRIGIWVFVALGGGAAFWQWLTLRKFQAAEEQLSAAVRDADEGRREPLHLADVERLFGSTKTVGPIPQGRDKMVIHVWRGPLKDYQ